MTTFTVDDVTPIGERDWNTGGYQEYQPFSKVNTLSLLKARLGKTKCDRATREIVIHCPPIEACSEAELIGPSGGLNSLIECLNHAYDRHLPVVLTPDVIWTCIAQGMAARIKAEPEKLRSQFVNFEGKVFLSIQRDGFVKGSPNNDWPGCFEEFGHLIKGHIGDKYDLFVGDFDTTTPVSKAASEIVLMDAMSKYFEYGMSTACGFSRITLEGSSYDWKEIQDRVKRLREIDPELGPTWFDHLDPVLEELVKAKTGNEDKRFWSNFYKRVDPGSGAPYVTGWVNTLFPYLADDSLNNCDWTRSCGPSPDKFPNGLSEVDVKWKYHSQEFDLKFLGGMVGVSENLDDGYALEPQFGWAVYDATAPLEVSKR